MKLITFRLGIWGWFLFMLSAGLTLLGAFWRVSKFEATL